MRRFGGVARGLGRGGAGGRAAARQGGPRKTAAGEVAVRGCGPQEACGNRIGAMRASGGGGARRAAPRAGRAGTTRGSSAALAQAQTHRHTAKGLRVHLGRRIDSDELPNVCDAGAGEIERLCRPRGGGSLSNLGAQATARPQAGRSIQLHVRVASFSCIHVKPRPAVEEGPIREALKLSDLHSDWSPVCSLSGEFKWAINAIAPWRTAQVVSPGRHHHAVPRRAPLRVPSRRCAYSRASLQLRDVGFA